jgi:hypothetical protein
LEEYTNSNSDSESEGAVLDEGYELHGENYDPVSDAEHDSYYWEKMSQDLRKKYVFPLGMELTCTKEN